MPVDFSKKGPPAVERAILLKGKRFNADRNCSLVRIGDLVGVRKKLKPNEKILIRVYSQGRSGYLALEPK